MDNFTTEPYEKIESDRSQQLYGERIREKVENWRATHGGLYLVVNKPLRLHWKGRKTALTS